MNYTLESLVFVFVFVCVRVCFAQKSGMEPYSIPFIPHPQTKKNETHNIFLCVTGQRL